MQYMMFASESEALETVCGRQQDGNPYELDSDADAIDRGRSGGWEVVIKPATATSGLQLLWTIRDDDE